MFVKSTATAYYGYDEFGFGLYDPEEQVFHPALEENGPYLTCLKFYNNLYQKGLLDPDSQTQGYDGMAGRLPERWTAFLNVFNFLRFYFLQLRDSHASGRQDAMAPCPPEDAAPICLWSEHLRWQQYRGLSVLRQSIRNLCMAILNWLCYSGRTHDCLSMVQRMSAGTMMKMVKHMFYRSWDVQQRLDIKHTDV